MSYLYLVRAECSNCGEMVDHTEETESPVNVDQDVGISATFCPECGVEDPFWDVYEEAEVERMPPADEVGSGVRDSISAIKDLIADGPDVYLFASMEYQGDEDSPVATLYRTNGDVPVGWVFGAIANLVLKVSRESGIHPAEVLKGVLKLTEQNVDASRIEYDLSEEFRFKDD